MTFWKNRKVVVTGVSGYLGRELLKQLDERGASVVGIDIRPPVKAVARMYFEQGELTDSVFTHRVLIKHKIKTCFHLAGLAGVAYCQQHPLEAFEANGRATWCFLEGCRAYGKLSEIIVTSSNHVYGLQTCEPTTEDAPLNGHGVYATSKACADMIVRCYAKTYGLPVASARITNSFGGRDPHLDHLIAGAIMAVLSGEPPVIKGNGRATKGYLYVQDTIEGLIRYAERLREKNLSGHAINFAPAVPVSVIEAVREVLRVMNENDTVPQVLGDPSVMEEFEHLSNLKAWELLEWRPKYSFREGLIKAIEDYKQAEEIR